MAGYYDEETGAFINTGDVGSINAPLTDATSGTGTVGDYTNTQTFDDGSTLIMDKDGNVIGSTPATNGSATSGADILANAGAGTSSGLTSFFNSLGLKGSDLKSLITGNAGALTGLAALYSAMGGNKITNQNGGYSGSIPKYTATRAAVPYSDTSNMGRQNFTPVQFTSAADAPAAQAAANQQAQGIAAAAPRAAAQPNPYAGKFATPWVQKGQNMAAGGIAQGRYLQGKTDGMADKINTSIDGKQPAKLSHGEFVVPADVVSHLGNGNSDAGAQRLYAMMDKVRQARTGNKKQGKEINPDKFMPGGLATANYAGGGAVAFDDGGDVKGFAGTTGSTVAAPASTTGYGTSSSSTLSPWAGDYVTNMLGKGQALSEMPYQQYQGPLTAGPSDLQQQQSAGLSQLAQTGLQPTQFTNQFNAPTAYNPATFTSGTFDTGAAQQYMNPYLQASLDPQLKELQRQAQIANVADASKLTQAGAYGGGRQAVLMGEQNRNLLDKSQQLLGQGYNTAYDKAMAQFNADQARNMQAQQGTEASRQFGANQGLTAAQNTAQYGQAANAAQEAANQASAQFGLNTLGAMGTAGATQRDIEQQGLTAARSAFEAERDNPYKMVQYQQGLLQGLPITTNTTTPNQTGLSSIMTQGSDLLGLYQMLANLGQTKPTA
jgi:hypothetical protein